MTADAPKARGGRMVSIVDGDTIKVRIGDRTETVRYIGMNAPELHHPTKGEEPGGREAAEDLRQVRAEQGIKRGPRIELRLIPALDVASRRQRGRRRLLHLLQSRPR